MVEAGTQRVGHRLARQVADIAAQHHPHHAWQGEGEPHNGARGLHNWEGRCQGQSCSFYISPDNNSNCGMPWSEPSGDNNTTTKV